MIYYLGQAGKLTLRTDNVCKHFKALKIVEKQLSEVDTEVKARLRIDMYFDFLYYEILTDSISLEFEMWLRKKAHYYYNYYFTNQRGANHAK